MYQALYRKWRPRTFEEVVGQEHITTTLKNEMIQGKPAHAYLLMGSRGTGKTTCAKLIAKAVNCRNPVDGSPCGQCDCCRGVDNGSLVDVVEIDAASNNGVDNIRDLREEAVFLPNIAKYRVYIIDEAHMLSVGAVNALLKIMEEPPEHVIFILATTEVHKIPATIQSRCQRFDFKRIAPEVIRDRLLFIAGQEDMTLTEEAAALIARIADGGMRDALSLLDLCWAHAHDITVETVSEAAGLVGQDFGDAIRSYANTGDEDDRDLSRVGMSLEMFRAYTEGYLSQRAGQLNQAEIDHLAFSARYITFEQVLRFLMDYIDGDTYYKTKYPEHNLVRTRAQYKLLQSMEEQYGTMCEIVRETVAKYK